MTVSAIPETAFAKALADGGLAFAVGPLVVRLRCAIPSVAAGVRLLYGDYPVSRHGGFADFHVSIARPASVRRWFRPQVNFQLDGIFPFKPLPYAQAYPMFEWGLNWCIANHCHQFLMIHAAVVEKDGCAAILAAPPGSGKSTLCAALVSRGWRLLSDELALINPQDRSLTPIPRPISLKNESIDIIRRYDPAAVIGPVVRDTHKGTVSHVKAPADSVRRSRETARPAWIVFPRFQAGAPAGLNPYPKARALVRLAENAFNYTVLGEGGFEILTDIVDRAECYEFAYSRLDDALSIFADLNTHPICRAP
ncbi:HprK-related kinase A [Methylocaldum sp. MU1018]